MPGNVLTAAGRPGAYGKAPCAGDFLRIGMPKGVVSAWDPWVQAWLAGAAAALGPGYDAAYMSAPIWRFTLRAGLAGAAPVAGIVMPSVDRVGRRFPLTLAWTGGAAAASGPLAHHGAARARMLAAEDLALDMLEDGATRETLETGLAALADRPEGAAAQPPAPLRRLGRGQGAVWSAEIEGGVHMIETAGLPGRAEGLALLSLDAALWDEGSAA